MKTTIANCLKKASQLASMSDTPRLDIELLLAHILQKSRTYLFTWPDAILTQQQQNIFDDFFSRRLKGEPIAHIIGVREFWSLPISVNNSTLIPRPDTELLVETLLDLYIQDDILQQRTILDLGTGTGAIALALASEKPYWQLLAVDKEINAVTLAERNRTQLQLNNVQIAQSDWFSTFDNTKEFDAIVSNPPYIDPADIHLSQGDVRFEPRSALVAEKHGLADIELIVQKSWDYLLSQGYLLIEHGYDQGKAVRELFLRRGFSNINTLCDIGGNERVTLGIKILL